MDDDLDPTSYPDSAIRGLPGRFEIHQAIQLPPRPDGGGSTLELPLVGIYPAQTSAFVYGQRAARTVSGRHYHLGRSASKAPEIFLLLSGRATWRVADLQSIVGDQPALQSPAPQPAVESSPDESLDLPPFPSPISPAKSPPPPLRQL